MGWKVCAIATVVVTFICIILFQCLASFKVEWYRYIVDIDPARGRRLVRNSNMFIPKVRRSTSEIEELEELKARNLKLDWQPALSHGSDHHDCQAFFLSDGRSPVSLPETWAEARQAFQDVCQYESLGNSRCASAELDLFKDLPMNSEPLRMEPHHCLRLIAFWNYFASGDGRENSSMPSAVPASFAVSELNSMLIPSPRRLKTTSMGGRHTTVGAYGSVYVMGGGFGGRRGHSSIRRRSEESGTGEGSMELWMFTQDKMIVQGYDQGDFERTYDSICATYDGQEAFKFCDMWTPALALGILSVICLAPIPILLILMRCFKNSYAALFRERKCLNYCTAFCPLVTGLPCIILQMFFFGSNKGAFQAIVLTGCINPAECDASEMSAAADEDVSGNANDDESLWGTTVGWNICLVSVLMGFILLAPAWVYLVRYPPIVDSDMDAADSAEHVYQDTSSGAVYEPGQPVAIGQPVDDNKVEDNKA